jgi:hypothetical protein
MADPLPGSPYRPTPPPSRGFLNDLFPVDPRTVAGGLYGAGTEAAGNAAGWGASKVPGFPDPEGFGRAITGILDEPRGGLAHNPEVAAAPLAIGARRLKKGGHAAEDDASVASTLAARSEPGSVEGPGTGVPNLPTPHPVGEATPSAAPPGFTAYHGSPYQFDQFDISKIGTGEGAQAYGHGLYFAGNEDVARGYRDQLSSDTLRTPDGQIFDPQSQLQHLNVRVAARNNGEDLDATIARAQQLLPKASEQTAPMLQHDIGVLQGFKDAGGVSRNPGSMYQVQLNADPNQLLDWDKPFAEQSPNVQQAIRDLWTDKGGSLEGRTNPPFVASSSGDRGDSIHAAIATTYGAAGDADPQGAAAAALASKGVPGIKYLDQGSRGAGTGTSNYVMFNDKMIDILKRYGIPGLGLSVGAGALMNNPSSSDGSAVAAEQPQPPYQDVSQSDQEQRPPPIGSSPQFDDWWRQLQAQRFSGQDQGQQ